MRVDNYKMKVKVSSLYGRMINEEMAGRAIAPHEISQIILDKENRIAYVYCANWEHPRIFTFVSLPNMCLDWMFNKSVTVTVNRNITICRRRRPAWNENYI